MKFLDKLVTVFLSLLSICVSLFFIVTATKVVSLQYFMTSLSTLYGSWEAGVFGISLLVLSLCILVYILKPRELPETIVSESDLGKVAITLGAVESLVQKVIRDIEDVTESKIYIKKQ